MIIPKGNLERSATSAGDEVFSYKAKQLRDRNPVRWAHLQQQAWDKTGGLCWYCGIQTERSQTIDVVQFCVDHVLSAKRGGSDDAANLVPSCRSCNSTKGTKTIEEFREMRYRQLGARFSDDQLAYLDSWGISVPEPTFIPFWFEKEGL